MSKETIEYLRMDQPELKSSMKLNVPDDVTLVLTTITDIPSEIICNGHLFMTNYYHGNKFCKIVINDARGRFIYGSDSTCIRINDINTRSCYSIFEFKIFNYKIEVLGLKGYQLKHLSGIYPLKQLDYLYEYIIGNNDNDHLLKISTLKCYYNNIPQVDQLFEKRLKQDNIKIEPAIIKNNLEFIKNIDFLQWFNVCHSIKAGNAEIPCYFLNLPDEIKYIIGQYFWTPNPSPLFVDDTKTDIDDMFYTSSIDSFECSDFETDDSNSDKYSSIGGLFSDEDELDHESSNEEHQLSMHYTNINDHYLRASSDIESDDDSSMGGLFSDDS